MTAAIKTSTWKELIAAEKNSLDKRIIHNFELTLEEQEPQN